MTDTPESQKDEPAQTDDEGRGKPSGGGTTTTTDSTQVARPQGRGKPS